ncbi:hypothetical protein RFI_32862 [Reticulomyxa filosa]|uniref:Uncharacterized protein n=1 Tax=Reticulomyxa filosa TaxID=46433 RepID=X6LSC2_RETFI|nr:hypothetical protein RFI_32862 [Reticulomyxa filosa]|eukprot:ETO04534.1 hypothetical protein RFI_32862 [Reticulomyxa filosa]
MSQEYGTNLSASVYNILTKFLENYQKVSNLSHLDLFCLIPCLNYLRSIQSNISDTRFFNDQNIKSQEESKENNMKEMILTILQTDLRIRQSRDITPEIFTEAYISFLVLLKEKYILDQSSIRNQFFNIFNGSEFRELLSDPKDFEDFIHFINYQHQKQIICFLYDGCSFYDTKKDGDKHTLLKPILEVFIIMKRYYIWLIFYEMLSHIYFANIHTYNFVLFSNSSENYGGFERTHVCQTIEECEKKLREINGDNGFDITDSKEENMDKKTNSKEIWLFLDEFNTSPDIEWF